MLNSHGIFNKRPLSPDHGNDMDGAGNQALPLLFIYFLSGEHDSFLNAHTDNKIVLFSPEDRIPGPGVLFCVQNG